MILRLAKFNFKLLPLLLAFFALTGCVLEKKRFEEFQVIIDQVDWVKLLPYEPNDKGQYPVRTGCGRAEIKFKGKFKSVETAMLLMDEQCSNPHSAIPREQVFVIDQSGRLKEYYYINIDKNGNEYIDILDSYQPFDSVFVDLLLPLKSPLLIGEIEEEEILYNERYLVKGILIVEDGYLYLKKVIYLDDIKSLYHLH